MAGNACCSIPSGQACSNSVYWLWVFPWIWEITLALSASMEKFTIHMTSQGSYLMKCYHLFAYMSTHFHLHKHLYITWPSTTFWHLSMQKTILMTKAVKHSMLNLPLILCSCKAQIEQSSLSHMRITPSINEECNHESCFPQSIGSFFSCIFHDR